MNRGYRGFPSFPALITEDVDLNLRKITSLQTPTSAQDAANKAYADSLVKTILNVPTTYYVRTDGNDGNSGSANDAAHAWLTIQHAVDWVAQHVNANGHDVTIQLGNAGTWTLTATVNLKPIESCAYAFILGDDTNRANYIINSTTANLRYFLADQCPVHWVIEGVKGKYSGAGTADEFLYVHDGFGSLEFVDIEGNFNYPYWLDGSWGTWNSASVITNCSGSSLAYATGSAYLGFGHSDLTFSGTCAFSQGIIQGSYFVHLNWSVSGVLTGTATGKKYAIANDAFLYSSQSSSSMPGSLAGTVDTGSTFISPTEHIEPTIDYALPRTLAANLTLPTDYVIVLEGTVNAGDYVIELQGDATLVVL